MTLMNVNEFNKTSITETLYTRSKHVNVRGVTAERQKDIDSTFTRIDASLKTLIKTWCDSFSADIAVKWTLILHNIPAVTCHQSIIRDYYKTNIFVCMWKMK